MNQDFLNGYEKGIKKVFIELEKKNLQLLDVGVVIVKKDYDELKKDLLK